MALKGTSPIRVESYVHSLGCVLRSAVCEWLLLFLLLLDAAFSYFLTKFAQYCGLQLPCLFCSRLDHVFGNEKPDFYKNLLCSDHKREISSLVMCHNHHKLADIHGMCEECLLSFTQTETNEETCKLLVDKMGLDCPIPGSVTTRSCSCCSKSWETRPFVQKLVVSRPSPSISKPDIPLPKSPRHRCLNRQEGLKKRKNRFSVSTTPFVLGNMDYDILSRMGYTEVKITSDSDSDFPLSDDDDIIIAPRDPQSSNNGENLLQQSSEMLLKRQNDYFSQAQQILKSTRTTTIITGQGLEQEKGETTTPTFFTPGGNARHSLTDISWQQIHKRNSPELPEFTSLDDIPLTSDVPEISAVISTNEFDRSSQSKKLSGSSSADYSHKTASLSVNVQFAVNQSKENWLDPKGKDDIEHASAMSKWESIDLNGTTTVTEVQTDLTRKTVFNRDLKDLASSSGKEVKASGPLLEHKKRDCNVTGFSDELSASNTAITSRNSSFDKNSVVNGHVDKPQIESSDSTESRVLSKLPSIEKSPSVESQEGDVGENEEENLVDRLRQENEHGKKRISDLYKELEEERSAAAIAANQAMAMITKLQEEKAALHMEALQYLRMMEEQAEYDVDELEKANDVITEKEKEIQDLQAELDYFRLKYPEDFPEDPDLDEVDLEDAESSYMETVEFEKS
ncbi:putative myosin-binding protein 4 [Silene latifolia]|uniref:putative myosin-binding protein 4 n=1 Tax=Silene latifolia TaxID=37657 RepID=UPI003D77D71E